MQNTQPQVSSIRSALVQTSPSLALIKYWGKADTRENLPATPSLALTLSALKTETRLWALDSERFSGPLHDTVIVGGEVQDAKRYKAYFARARELVGDSWVFWAESVNNFPTAAGLASSSSGFAALSFALARALKADLGLPELSSLARLGSGSAARSLYGGFTLLPAAAESAEVLHPCDYWPELRLVVARIRDSEKEVSSRDAMELGRATSPYYGAWIDDAPKVCREAERALAKKDLMALGRAMRKSYLRMFSTMFSSEPPVLYWLPESLAVIKLCEDLRTRGLQVWETMDAGPQVKILCLEQDLDELKEALGGLLGEDRVLVDRPGPGPVELSEPELLGKVAPKLEQAFAKLLASGAD